VVCCVNQCNQGHVHNCSYVQISGSLRTNKWFAVLTNATKDMFTQLVLSVEISGSLRTNKWFAVLTNATKDMLTQLLLCSNKWFSAYK